MSLHIASEAEACGTEAPAQGLPLPAPGLRLCALAHGQLLQAAAFLASAGESRHAGLHQARKCIRRARAVLALGMCALDPRAERLDADLGRLCRGLSRLRDAQALIEALHRLAENAPDGLRAILPEAEAAARERRDRLLEQALARDPEFLARRRRLQALGDRLLRLNWPALGDAEVAAAVLRGQRRVGKAWRRARNQPENDHDWHVLRRRLRRVRQQDSLLAGIAPELRPAMEDLEEQAGRLGEAQDDALLLLHCGGASPFLCAQRVLLRRIAGERLRQARRS